MASDAALTASARAAAKCDCLQMHELIIGKNALISGAYRMAIVGVVSSVGAEGSAVQMEGMTVDCRCVASRLSWRLSRCHASKVVPEVTVRKSESLCKS